MDNKSYWKKRFAALEDVQYQKSKEYIQDVEKQFREASFRIQQDIEKWYYYNVPYKVDKTRRRDFLILNTAG